MFFYPGCLRPAERCQFIGFFEGSRIVAKQVLQARQSGFEIASSIGVRF
jgi:hypothetical protein